MLVPGHVLWAPTQYLILSTCRADAVQCHLKSLEANLSYPNMSDNVNNDYDCILQNCFNNEKQEYSPSLLITFLFQKEKKKRVVFV